MDPRYRLWEVNFCKKDKIDYEGMWNQFLQAEAHANALYMNFYTLKCLKSSRKFARDCGHVECGESQLQEQILENKKLESYCKIRDSCGNCGQETCVCIRCSACGLNQAACDCAEVVAVQRAEEEASCRDAVVKFLEELTGQFMAFHPSLMQKDVGVQQMLEWRWKGVEQHAFLQWHDKKFPQWNLCKLHGVGYPLRSRK